jgi:hypothetical protein
MKKILRDDVEVHLDSRGEEGLFAEFEHQDILKRIISKRRQNGFFYDEKLTLDQTAGTGHYRLSQIQATEDPSEAERIVNDAVHKMMNEVKYRVICDFCGAEQSPENRVLDGAEVKICADCVKLCREVLDEEGI